MRVEIIRPRLSNLDRSEAYETFLDPLERHGLLHVGLYDDKYVVHEGIVNASAETSILQLTFNPNFLVHFWMSKQCPNTVYYNLGRSFKNLSKEQGKLALGAILYRGAVFLGDNIEHRFWSRDGYADLNWILALYKNKDSQEMSRVLLDLNKGI